MEKNIKPIYSDIFPINETKGLFKFMALVRFNKHITEKRITEYNLGKSREEIYKAVASIKYKSRTLLIDCYFVIKPVKLNAVGNIVADDGYIVAVLEHDTLEKDHAIEVKNIELIEKVKELPEWE